MTYPKYYKSAAFHIKEISARKSVWVGNDSIELTKYNAKVLLKYHKESTEKEFKAAFNKTSKYIKSLI